MEDPNLSTSSGNRAEQSSNSRYVLWFIVLIVLLALVVEGFDISLGLETTVLFLIGLLLVLFYTIRLATTEINLSPDQFQGTTGRPIPPCPPICLTFYAGTGSAVGVVISLILGGVFLGIESSVWLSAAVLFTAVHLIERLKFNLK